MSLNGRMGLGFVLTARDMASAKLARVERQFASLDDRVTGGGARIQTAFRQIGTGLALFGAGAAGIMGSLSLAEAAGTFEQGLAAVGAVSRATADELALLRDAAFEAGIATQFSPDQAVAGLTSLATAGQTAAQATRTLIPVLDLAAGSLGQLGVAEAAEAVVGTLNAYGMAAEESAGVTDRLLRITQLTNFQARDFAFGLSKAAASGSVFNQSLDDVLITMGLLRNRNIDASSAATAFREATRRVGAEERAQRAIQEAGIETFDQTTGRMRSIIDIMSDFTEATRTMTDEERNRLVVTAFGARGLLAFNAVMNAAYTTSRNGTAVTLKGAEAIAALREEMAGAGGTAQSFREQLLDTFAGQKTLLQGTMQTLAVALGEPFAQVMKPVVASLTAFLNRLLRAWKDLSPGVKRAVATFVMGASAFLAVTGAVMALKGALALARIGLAALGVSFKGLVLAALPALATFAVVVAAVQGLRYAFEHNLGGIGDFAQKAWASVSLVFRGLTQLFEQGGFSGAVREELSRAEHGGVRAFLIGVWRFVHRVNQAWEAFKAGFRTTLAAGAEVFRAMSTALGALWASFRRVLGALLGGANSATSAYEGVGFSIGEVFAAVVQWVARVVGWVARATAGILDGFGAVIGPVRRMFVGLWRSLNTLFGEIAKLFGAAEGSAMGFGDVLWAVGAAVGWLAGVIATVLGTAIRLLIDIVSVVVRALRAFGEAIGEGLGAIVVFFATTLPNALKGAWQWLRGWFADVGAFFLGIGEWLGEVFGQMAEVIVEVFRPVLQFFQKLIEVIWGVIQAIVEAYRAVVDFVTDDVISRIFGRQGVHRAEAQGAVVLRSETERRAFELQQRAARGLAVESAPVAAADHAAAKGRFEDLGADLQRLATPRAGEPREERITLEVDGQRLAEVVRRADQDGAARSFAPVPAL